MFTQQCKSITQRLALSLLELRLCPEGGSNSFTVKLWQRNHLNCHTQGFSSWLIYRPKGQQWLLRSRKGSPLLALILLLLRVTIRLTIQVKVLVIKTTDLSMIPGNHSRLSWSTPCTLWLIQPTCVHKHKIKSYRKVLYHIVPWTNENSMQCFKSCSHLYIIPARTSRLPPPKKNNKSSKDAEPAEFSLTFLHFFFFPLECHVAQDSLRGNAKLLILLSPPFQCWN